MNDRIEKVDHSALRVNQAMIIVLLIAAFVVDAVGLVAVVALAMFVGTALRQPGFKWVYARFLEPRGIVKPDVIEDNLQPHVFAQGLGATFLAAGVVAFLLNTPVIGWGLTWLVVALAALNLFIGFCVGCFVYYWLSRMRVPGFVAQPIPGAFPGMRPSGRAN